MKTLALSIFGLFAVCLTSVAQLEKILAPVSGPGGGQTETQSAGGRAPRALTGDDLLALLEKRLTEHFSITGELKLGMERPWRTTKLPADDCDVTITEYPAEGVNRSFLIRCKIISGGQNLGECQLALRAQLWQEVWVATGRLDRGQPIDRSLVTAQKVDVLRDRESLINADVDPTLYEVAQNVAAGRALTKRDIVDRPLIRKGEVVEVIASHGMLTVSMKAQALESGIANALIKMRNLESRKEFTAQIVNENQVKVLF
jgi:flagella basal body P-ring formation protein FlgA